MVDKVQSRQSQKSNLTLSRFYRATLMHSADYAVARCLSVCSSVRPFVCLSCQYCV